MAPHGRGCFNRAKDRPKGAIVKSCGWKFQAAWFLFPQMLVSGRAAKGSGDRWLPRYVDYLFLTFNTSTAFLPTDTAILVRPAKLLVMGQSIISLAIVALLASRTVNII